MKSGSSSHRIVTSTSQAIGATDKRKTVIGRKLAGNSRSRLIKSLKSLEKNEFLFSTKVVLLMKERLTGLCTSILFLRLRYVVDIPT